MDKLIVSISQNAVIRAESEILGCDRCAQAAKVPFWQILDKLRIYQDAEVVYILPVLASCPRCRAPIDEITAVEPRVLSNVNSTNQPVMGGKA